MDEMSGEWMVALGLFVLLLAVAWQALFPGLTDTSPETEADTDPGHADARAGRFDLPG